MHRRERRKEVTRNSEENFSKNATIGTILVVDWAEIGVAQFFKVPTTRNLGISSLQLMGLEPKSGGPGLVREKNKGNYSVPTRISKYLGT